MAGPETGKENINTVSYSSLRVVTCKGDARAVHPKKHEAIICCRNVSTYIQTELEQELFALDFRADSNAIVFSFCWSKR